MATYAAHTSGFAGAEDQLVLFYLPKKRIRLKVAKSQYRARYERRMDGRAQFAKIGFLIGVRVPEGHPRYRPPLGTVRQFLGLP